MVQSVSLREALEIFDERLPVEAYDLCEDYPDYVKSYGFFSNVYSIDEFDGICVLYHYEKLANGVKGVEDFVPFVLALGGINHVRTYLRCLFFNLFELEVEVRFDGVHEPLMVSEAQYFGQKKVQALTYGFVSAFSAGARAIGHAKTTTVDYIWDLAKRAFVACLGGYYETLVSAAGWIKDIWTRMRVWSENILKESALWMEGFQECLTFGMGIIGIGAVLVLIEKFMVGSHLISNPLNLAQTFVLCYVGYIGLRTGGLAIRDGVQDKISNLISACKQVVEAMAVSMTADGTMPGAGDLDKVRAQFSPLSLLEVFSNTVGNISASTVVDTGRVFNAFSQIKSGSMAIWGCVQTICESMWDLLDKGFGIKSRALADLSGLLSMDIQGWLRRCDAACESLVLTHSIQTETLDHLKQVQLRGRQIRDHLVVKKHTGSASALQLVTRALDRITPLLERVIVAGSSGPRFEPFWIAFVGDSGVGKSTAVNMLATRYLREHELDISDCYTRAAVDKFWTGYRRQTVVTYDDLGCVTTANDVPQEAELIQLVSRDAVGLNMADVSEKGIYFDSRLIISSSNFIRFNPRAQIHNVKAYERRRAMLVEIVHKDGADMDPDNPVGHQRYVLRHREEPYAVIKEFESFDDLYAEFATLMERHADVQKRIMEKMMVSQKSVQKSLRDVTSYLMLQKPYEPLGIQLYLKDKYPGYNILASFGDVLYIFNEAMDVKIIKNLHQCTGVEACDIKVAHDNAMIAALRYYDMLKHSPGFDPMATHYMRELVFKRVFTDDLEIRPGLYAEDEQLYIAASEMDRWQRAFVLVFSECMAVHGKSRFSHMFNRACEVMKRAYTADVAAWPIAVKLGLGVTFVLVFGGALFKTLNYLGNFGTGAAFAVAASNAISKGQSDDQVRKRTAEYRHRNNPIQTRHWSHGQSSGINYEWLMQHCLASLRYAHMDCQVLMLPGKRLVGVHHFLRRLPDKVMIEISLEAQKYYVCWHKDNLQQLEGSELSVYTHPTLRDVANSVQERIVFGLEHLPDTFPAVLCSCKYDEMSKAYVSEVAPIDVYKRTRALTIYAGDYQRNVPTCLEYRARTVNKDCGSLLIAKIDGVDRLVGVHVAGLGGYGQAGFLPLSLEVSKGQNWFENDFSAFSCEEQLGNGTQVVGLMKPEKRFFTQQKTAYVQTEEAWHVGTPCDKVPAVLAKGDVRLVGTPHEDYDPYRNGMEKYAQEAGPFEPEILEQVASEIVGTWKDADDGFDFSETSIAEAINGVPGVDYMDSLVLNSSEGYPYMLSRDNNKGKARFLVEDAGQLVPNEELMAGILRIEEEAAAGGVTLVGVECAKDEKLPVRKVFDKPKTRLFTVLPMDYNIVVRRKFFPFVRFLMLKRDMLPCQVGINPYSREWNRLANSLLEKGDTILCCDYSRFDGILPKHVMFTIALMINEVMGGSHRLQTQRIALLMACVGRYGICAGKVWRVENGIPSGFPLTVIINSIFNEIIVRYLYRMCFVNDELMRASFARYVKLVVYGDDNLISVHPTITSKFNGKFVQQHASFLDITITDGVDKTLPTLEFRPLTGCDFLKRRFVLDQHGLWRAPMELESLWSQLHWVKCKHLQLHEAYLLNVESVLRELYLHDIGLCRDMRCRILAIDWVQPSHLPTLEQIRAFHDMQLHGSTQFDGFAYDALITPYALGPIGAVERDVRDFEHAGMVATVSGSYKFEEGDFVCCLKVASKYGVNGISVEWPLVSGRAELPTAAWLRERLMGKNSELHRVLRTQRRAGRRLIFLGRNSNICPVIFLVLFGISEGVVDVSDSNKILSRAIEVTNALGYLLEAFPEAFFSKERRSISYAGRKEFKVFGASSQEVAIMRSATKGKVFEKILIPMPVFSDFKMLVDYMQGIANIGIVVVSAIEIPDLGDLPGLLWRDWIGKKRNVSYDARYVVQLVVYDSGNSDIFEAKAEGVLIPGNRLDECFLIDGKPLGKLPYDLILDKHPVALAASMMERVVMDTNTILNKSALC